LVSFFIRRGDAYEATELTRGPWSPHHQHGGPPGALLAGRIAAAHPGAHVGRVTLEFLRPVPIGALTIELAEPEGGRRVARARGALRDAQGQVVLAATLLLMRSTPFDAAPAPRGEPPPGPDDCGAAGAAFPFFRWETGYHTAMELRFARGAYGAGPVTVWMRPRVPLLPGEALSPLERVMCAVDSVHGVSWTRDPREMTAINPDLSVALHRHPEGEWVALEAETANQPTGLGVAHSRLWDARGPIGWSLQTLVLAPVTSAPA
jgi:hypothetical protein